VGLVRPQAFGAVELATHRHRRPSLLLLAVR
jgi:hypothetical protein